MVYRLLVDVRSVLVPSTVGLLLLCGVLRVVYLRRVESMHPWWSPLFRYKQVCTCCATVRMSHLEQLIALLFMLYEIVLFAYALASHRYTYMVVASASLVLGQVWQSHV